jgi:hypothetical protein
MGQSSISKTRFAGTVPQHVLWAFGSLWAGLESRRDRYAVIKKLIPDGCCSDSLFGKQLDGIDKRCPGECEQRYMA